MDLSAQLVSLVSPELAIYILCLTELVKEIFVKRFEIMNNEWLPVVSVALGLFLGFFGPGVHIGFFTGFVLTYGIKFVDNRLVKLTPSQKKK